MNSYSRLAAAVSAILGTAAAGAAFAAPPSIAAAAAAPVKLYIAGSSAAKNGIIGSLQSDLCGGAANALTVSSTGNKNFFAVSCTPASGVAGANGSTVYTVYYRDEGGSVSGALPIANSVAIDQLNLSDAAVTAACGTAGTTACGPAVTGTSSANGTTDSFGGPVTKALVQVGILDVEPGALTGANYPTQYSTSVWGPVNQAGVASLPSVGLFNEVYGFFVNTSGGTFPAKLSLSKQTLNAIFSKGITDWSLVTDAVTGGPASSSSLPITLFNREAGSGSRAATDLLIGGDTCSSFGAPIKEQTKSGFTDYFATGDVLAAAAAVSGGIAYATIDQSVTNLSLVQYNGVAPSNLAAATGQYDFWVEAQAVVNPNVTNSTPVNSLISFFVGDLQQIAKMPHLADINAIPSGTNTASSNVVSTGNTAPVASQPTIGAATIYVNPFTRNGVTCSLPTSTQ